MITIAIVSALVILLFRIDSTRVMNPIDSNAEWIEADGLGGFASGTVSGIRSRRYHALLLTATTPPAGRMVLVNGFDAWVETPDGTVALSSQRYGPDVIHPDGATRIESFEYEPWPRWRYKIDNDLFVEQELFIPKGESAVFISWKLVSNRDADLKLKVRPFLSGRDFHSTHHENGAFRFDAEQNGEARDLSILRRRSGCHGAFERPLRARARRGIEIFSTPKNRPAGSTLRKISRRPASSNFHFLKNRRC